MSKLLVAGFIFGLITANFVSAVEYYGNKLGSLSTLNHDVSGDVFAVDSRTLFIKNFNYDGQGPAAQFLVGTSPNIGADGSIVIRDERGTTNPLQRYRNKHITLTLPEGKTLRDIRWLSVWCYEFSVDFGNIRIPANLDYPKPQKISRLNGVHRISSDPIVIVDAQTLLVPNFSYDGEAPDAKFWVGRGSRPTPNGILIPDENGRVNPLGPYDKKTIVLTLPGDLTVFDIGHFGVWCVAFTVDFGHIQIPNDLNVPPSLKMLGISPQSKLNCEVLYDDLAFEVRWAVAGESVVVQLVAKLEKNEYMSFGISPDNSRSIMIGSDVVVAWVDMITGKGYAHDYYLDAKSQCSGKRGSCPDVRLLENSNSIRLLNAAMVNGYSIVTYQRPLKASDRFDLPITLNGTQAVVWAIGPLNERQEVSFHTHYTNGDRNIDFGRQAVWNCPLPDGEMKMNENERSNYEEETYETPNFEENRDEIRRDKLRQTVRENHRQQSHANRRESQEQAVSNKRRPIPPPKPAPKNGAWTIPPIECDEPEDGVLFAQMGPTGGKHGYPAITGHVGWGISWYINGLLIPEINVVRGKMYSFVVEAGDDPNIPAKYHPFYITDDPVGGYEYKTDEEKDNVTIYAGVQRSRSGKVVPVGVGRFCTWQHDQNTPEADEFSSFGAYQRTLSLKCEFGDPGIVQWQPDENTPDTVYYQCFTHRYLGWKINVLDHCDRAEASEKDEVYIEPNADSDPLESEPSILHETKVKPNDFFRFQHDKDLIKNHNMNEQPPKVQFDLNKGSEISKIIADGIKAAEALEESIATSRKNLSQTYVHHEKIPSTIKHLQGESSYVSTTLNQPTGGHYGNTTNKPLPGFGLSKRPVDFAAHRPPLPPPPFGRRPPPMYFERRKPNPSRPSQLTQPSIIVNHYKKPVPPIMRPFVKETNPIKQIASVLVLGKHTDIELSRKVFDQKPTKTHVKRPSKIPLREVKKPVIQNQNVVTRKKPLRDFSKEKLIPKNQFKAAYEVSNDRLIPDISAHNTGFKPDSVIVEGGFRPIVRRRNENDVIVNQNRRTDENVSDLEENMDGDALFINQEIQNRVFEPMFIPSPPDSLNMSDGGRPHKHNHLLVHQLRDMEIEDGDDKLAMAGERVDAYYLPPDTKKKTIQTYPEGSVVTYDGKAVLDTSLVNIVPPPLPQHQPNEKFLHSGHLSRSEQLIRNSPQFGPFTGEIPPPIPDFVSTDTIPQLKLSGNATTKTQVPVTEYTNPISTKLTLLSPSKTKREDKTS